MQNNDTILADIEDEIISGDLDNEGMIKLAELCLTYLNAQTISDYAKLHNISYNGVKYHRNFVKIRGVKFVIDNE
jgi:hypothetical protein